MSFWSDPTAKEPLRKNKWLISFTKGLKDYTYGLKTCTKPSYIVENSSHVLLNYTFNFPKRVVWQPITITFASVRNKDLLITDDNADQALSIRTLSLANQLYFYINSLDPLSGIYTDPLGTPQDYSLSKDALVQNFEGPILRLLQINENGNAVENWFLYNAYISEVKFGDLSYESEDIVDVTLTIVYDYAKLTNKVITTFLEQPA